MFVIMVNERNEMGGTRGEEKGRIEIKRRGLERERDGGR